jgi:hypothetical protein
MSFEQANENSRIPETPLVERILRRVDTQMVCLADVYSGMPEEKKRTLPEMKVKAQKELISIIKGESDAIYDMSDEERELVIRVHNDFVDFINSSKERYVPEGEKPASFQIILNNIEKKIWANLFSKVLLVMMENEEIKEDLRKADEIKRKLCSQVYAGQ